MKQYVINQFHFYGAFIAGDFIEIHDNPSASFYQGQHVPFVTTTAEVEDVEPVVEDPEPIDSIIFTKKARVEHKEPAIIAALQKSVQGRKDKTRAFVQELHDWQNQAYVDAHFNARVMYDELEKLMPISFGYDGFKRLYNNSRN